MKNRSCNLNLFNNILISFLKEISQKKNWQVNDIVILFEKGIKIYNEELTNNDYMCEGLVTTNGENRRCSRKKKYGKFCGLHYNKEKKYKNIETVETYSILYLSDNTGSINIDNIKNVHNKIDSININNKIINNTNDISQKNLVLNCIDKNSLKLKWEKTKLGCKELYLNNIDNYIYAKIFNEYMKIGIYDKIDNKILELA